MEFHPASQRFRTKCTPARTLFISGLKSRVMKLPFLSLKMMVKSGLEFILKLTEPLQSCCCPVQKYLPRLAELAWQLSRYLWRGSVNFKINSRPLFTIIFKLKNDNFMTRDFSLLIEWVLTGVSNLVCLYPRSKRSRLSSSLCQGVLYGRLAFIYLSFWDL